jgi:hypothetical protein
LLLIGAVVLLLLFAWEAFAVEPLTIVEVRRNIPLSEKDTVYRDYYITGGASDGLKQHMVVEAVRKIGIKDPSGAQTVGEIQIPVAQLKIIYVGDKVSIGRMYKEISREDQGMLEQTGVQVGDHLELKSSFVDNRKPPVKTQESDAETKSAVNTAPKPVEPVGPREASASPSEDGTAP